MGALSLGVFNSTMDKGLGGILQEIRLPRGGKRITTDFCRLPMTQQEDGSSLEWKMPWLL